MNISEILETVRGYAPDADLTRVMEAYLLAAKAHAGQKRKSGEPYLTHPLSVALILAQMKMDTDTIATALLHDALEDNPITKEQMAKEIGPEITELVDGVTKIGKLKFRSKEELQAENFRKMMLAMSRDIRVILVKLADRLHNMVTLEHHAAEKRAEIAEETMDVFVPIANRLGLTRIKCELEDLCFKALEPEAYAHIHDYLRDTAADRDAYTSRVSEKLHQQLTEMHVPCDVSGRAKHCWSICKKMRRQDLKVTEVQDLLAFRVIVSDVGQCYAALGLLHSLFPPVPDRIKDYIARPKPNGYQSLHTTVLGPEGRRVEIQIRTPDMHRVAEDGVAAHWQYKEGRLALDPKEVLRIGKVRDLFDTAREAENAEEFMETVKVELYADEVFIFTPAGDIKTFPLGATTLDFAYAVHTDVGSRCTGARVDGKLVPLRYQLRSGDTVEIMTSPNQRPKRDWLEIAKTGRAVQKIRKALRDEETETGVRLGREMLESELRKHGWAWARVKKEGNLKEVLKRHDYKEPEPLFVDIARGALTPPAIVKELIPENQYSPPGEPAQAGVVSNLLNKFRGRAESPVLITGEDGVLVSYAGCCSPLPGEPVVGYITRGRGITVHSADCEQLKKLDAERRILVEWDPSSQAKHSGEIQIYCADRPGMLANITRVCELNNVNITRAEARGLSDDRAVCTLDVAVRSLAELQKLVKNIEKIRGVEQVVRA